MTNELKKLEKIVKALDAMNVEATIEHSGTIYWSHDDVMLMAGTTHGTFAVDVYELQMTLEADDGEEWVYMTTADSGMPIDTDPRVLAAFFKGVREARIY